MSPSKIHTSDDPASLFVSQLLLPALARTATIRAQIIKDILLFIKQHHTPAWLYVWPNGRIRTYDLHDLPRVQRMVPDPHQIRPVFLPDPAPTPHPLAPYIDHLRSHLQSSIHQSLLDLSPTPDLTSAP